MLAGPGLSHGDSVIQLTSQTASNPYVLRVALRDLTSQPLKEVYSVQFFGNAVCIARLLHVSDRHTILDTCGRTRSGGVTASTGLLVAERHAGVGTPVIAPNTISAEPQYALAA